MGATIDALLALQNIERQLAVVRDQTDARRREIGAHKRALQKHEQIVAEKQAAITSGQVEIDRIDLTVKSQEESLSRHREGLNRAKTNKEYAAILTAINTEKADNSKLENRQLQLMADLDALRAGSEKSIADRDAIVQRIAQAEQVLQEFLDRSKSGTGRLQRERADAADRIDGVALATFERVAERHGGEAMAEIVVLNAKRHEHACGGCNMSLTLQTVIAAQTTDDLRLCSSCGRVLYHDTTAHPGR